VEDRIGYSFSQLRQHLVNNRVVVIFFIFFHGAPRSAQKELLPPEAVVC